MQSLTRVIQLFTWVGPWFSVLLCMWICWTISGLPYDWLS